MLAHYRCAELAHRREVFAEPDAWRERNFLLGRVRSAVLPARLVAPALGAARLVLLASTNARSVPIALINVAGVFGCLAAASLLLLRRPDPPEPSIEWAPAYVSRSFLRMAEPAALSNALFAFVTDPRSSRRRRRIIGELADGNPHTVDVLELMVLDGVREQQAVADYVQAVVGEAMAESDQERPVGPRHRRIQTP